MIYKFKVRFEGYGFVDDMWLLVFVFNKFVLFGLMLCFGWKWKYKIDVEDFVFLL